jgi:hypothetical protein
MREWHCVCAARAGQGESRSAAGASQDQVGSVVPLRAPRCSAGLGGRWRLPGRGRRGSRAAAGRSETKATSGDRWAWSYARAEREHDREKYRITAEAGERTTAVFHSAQGVPGVSTGARRFLHAGGAAPERRLTRPLPQIPQHPCAPGASAAPGAG